MLIWEKYNYRLNFPFVTICIIAIGLSIYVMGFSKYLYFVPSDPLSITLVTSLFSHKNIFHIFINYIYLYKLGDNVEDVLGPLLYTISYLFLGIVANLGYYSLHPDSYNPVLGSSGAVSGLMGIYCIFFPKVKASMFFTGERSVAQLPEISISYALIFWLLMQGVMMIFEASGEFLIAYSAHTTGFLSGLALGLLFKQMSFLENYERKVRYSTGQSKTVLCPSCNSPAVISGYGRFKCPACGTEYIFTRNEKKILSLGFTAPNRSASRIELSLDRCESSRPEPAGLGRWAGCV